MSLGQIVIGILTVFVAVGSMVLARMREASDPPETLSPLAKIIYAFNRQQAIWVGGPTFSEPAKGVSLTEDTEAQAEEVADVLEATVPASAPMQIPLALLGSESDLSIICFNGNREGSNKANDPGGYDDGVAQEKLKYLIGQPGVKTIDDARAFALDPKRAIPYFWSLYQAHLRTADEWIAAGGPSTIDQRLMNRWILAAVVYKQGPAGARNIFEAGLWPPELNNFVSLESWFAKELGVKSLFTGLT